MPDEYRIGRLNGGYVVTWWEDGKRRRYRLDAQSRKEAEAAAIDVIRRETVKAETATVKVLWDLYRQEKQGRRIADAMAFEWKAIGPHFEHLRFDQVTIEHCRAYTELRRAKGKHDGTIWTELGHLRTVFIWAHKRRVIAFAPAVERPPKPAPKDRWLNDAEIAKLLAADCAPHIKLAILLMLGTAGRVSAILELTWDRVEFDTNTINLRTSETGPRKGRAAVPMNAGLRAALSAAKGARLTDYVIEWAGEPVKRIKTGFNAAVRKAGLVGVSPHVLRHTAAVHMVAAGRPMARVSQYLGHSNVQITEHAYGRFAPEHLQEEADVLDFATRAMLVRKV
jgi:integrase